MPNNPYVNKVKLGDNQVLIDLTTDNITASDVVAKKSDGTTNVSFHLPSGAITTGTIPRRSSSDVTTSGPNVTVESGYYASTVSKSVDTTNLASANIKDGITILGTTGSLLPRPNWVANSKAVWTDMYFNKDIDWDTILPLLPYDSSTGIYTFGISDSSAGALEYTLIAKECSNSKYAILLVYILATVTPIYATADIDEDITLVTTVHLTASHGWNNSYVHLSTNQGLAFTDTISYTGGTLSISEVVAGDDLAFGDYVATPTTGTLTITENRTYTFEELSQYSQIIIDVPSSSGGSYANITNDTLIFNDNTSVDDDTLELDNVYANVVGDTLILDDGQVDRQALFGELNSELWGT